jgi:hypothetical protein
MSSRFVLPQHQNLALLRGNLPEVRTDLGALDAHLFVYDRSKHHGDLRKATEFTSTAEDSYALGHLQLDLHALAGNA